MGSQAAGLPSALAMMVTTQTAAGWPLVTAWGVCTEGKDAGLACGAATPSKLGL